MKLLILSLSLLLTSNSFAGERFTTLINKEYSTMCNSKSEVEKMKNYLPKGFSCITSKGEKGKVI